MPDYIDQTGHSITLKHPPERIVSLVPSQTELLYYLGLDKEVVGITKFCIHPDKWFRSKCRVGGTKQIKMDLIHDLKPDLILANKEENVKEQVEEMAQYYPVWTSNVNNLADAYEMINQVGRITGKETIATSLCTNIKNNFAEQRVLKKKPRAVYLIWQKPYMTVGGDTFIHAMMDAAGFENVFKNKYRYPEITTAAIQASQCDVLLLSSEPFPFQQEHINELQPQLPGVKILLADGEIFSWYGSRMLQAPAYFSRLLGQISKVGFN
jgi:ABC-type Fe3+-hydroxamate transport system substrate-binding protein